MWTTSSRTERTLQKDGTSNFYVTATGHNVRFCKYIIQICWPSQRRKTCGIQRALPRGTIPRRISSFFRSLLSNFSPLPPPSSSPPPSSPPLLSRSSSFFFFFFSFPISFSHRYIRKLSYVFILHGLFGVQSRVFAPILFHFPLLQPTLRWTLQRQLPVGL